MYGRGASRSASELKATNEARDEQARVLPRTTHSSVSAAWRTTRATAPRSPMPYAAFTRAGGDESSGWPRHSSGAIADGGAGRTHPNLCKALHGRRFFYGSKSGSWDKGNRAQVEEHFFDALGGTRRRQKRSPRRASAPPTRRLFPGLRPCTSSRRSSRRDAELPLPKQFVAPLLDPGVAAVAAPAAPHRRPPRARLPRPLVVQPQTPRVDRRDTGPCEGKPPFCAAAAKRRPRRRSRPRPRATSRWSA